MTWAGAITVSTDGHPAIVADAPLETGLTLPSIVVPVGFGEVRVTVVPPVAPAMESVTAA